MTASCINDSLGATPLEIQRAVEAGVAGFRCECTVAEHSGVEHHQRLCSIWMPRRGLCPACQQFKVVNGVEVCGCNCSECKVEQDFQGYSCACTYTVGTAKCKNLVS